MRFLGLFFLFLLMFFSMGSNIFAESAEEIFFNANKQYAEGNYLEAACLYEKIIDQGVEGANVYYNLGNSYFKLGKQGKALLNYERAKKFITHDEDLLANYDFVYSLLNVKQPEENYSWLEKVYLDMRGIFSLRAWFFIAMGCFILLCIFMGIAAGFPTVRKNAYLCVYFFAIFFLLSIAVFFKAYQDEEQMKIGIIVVAKAQVRYSPSYNGAVAFEITEGVKAQIIRQTGQWSQVRLNRRNSGWLESESIEKI